MLKLYDYLSSGNGYKVRLLLHQLGTPFERIDLDIDRGETRTDEYLAKNPNGKIPALELEDGTVLAESNAIMWYLAEGTPFLPDGRLDRARALQWMFFEQYSHEPYVAVVRYIVHHLDADHPRRAEIASRMEQGYAALGVMETRLSEDEYFVGGRYSIADIALYAYTHVAHEGDFELDRFPAVRTWLDRVASQPRHVSIDHA